MNQSTDRAIKRSAHWSVWLVGIIALVWNVMGCANYMWQMNMSPDALSAMSAAQRAIIENRPAWATGGFAIAVFAGAIGSVLLLLRKSLSLVFFVLSVIGVIVSMLPVFGIVNSGVVFSAFEKTMYLVLTPLLAAFLVWYTRWAISRGWVGNKG